MSIFDNRFPEKLLIQLEYVLPFESKIYFWSGLSKKFITSVMQKTLLMTCLCMFLLKIQILF